ncbi:MAG: hypothetical protein HQ581_17935, partial [Planctomycetes bacterium]|nr:hypothetical protein [Planctomycetota bacterium]
MSWRPKHAAGRIRAKRGEPIRIPPLGPLSSRIFTEEEKREVVSVLDFEIPFALEGLQGYLPLPIRLSPDIDTRVLVSTRQKHPEDIATSLRLADLTPPKRGVIVAEGDHYGRINVSAIQFQLQGFVDLSNHSRLFDDCLREVNRIIEWYRSAKREFGIRRIAKADILAYGANHLFQGQTYNIVVQPVVSITLSDAPSFPDDVVLQNRLWFQGQIRADLWVRLLGEARHHAFVGANRLAIISSITALEVVLREDHGKNLAEFLAAAGLSFERWRGRKNRDSVSVCLNLLNMLHKELGLDGELTQRLWAHYERRNAIVHSGTMRVRGQDAMQCIEDIHLLIRHLLGLVHLSVAARFRFVAVPPDDVSFELLRMSSPEIQLGLGWEAKALTVSVKGTSGEPQICMRADLDSLIWSVGDERTVSFSYDSRSRVAEFRIDARVIATASKCKFGAVDASLLQPEAIDEPTSCFN